MNPIPEDEIRQFDLAIRQATGADLVAWMSWAVFADMERELFEEFTHQFVEEEPGD